ncbi:hypothetical protein CH379_018375 [Leptospira ellisii]|uniref:Uncharacterized protein n=1 Tax=Leptospira ellisii TaxID=2023197 RepID=A0AAE4QR30_9LEPT|nr:hypothetical protein [Leptospira ellisii]MDV6237603.1 hypothetical protein [Leptospira ellisii]PKA03579.1 hypothetical protein CH375_16125 [Leptospira ellisii]
MSVKLKNEKQYLRKTLEDKDTFFVRDLDGEYLYMSRRDAIRFLDRVRKLKSKTPFNDAA